LDDFYVKCHFGGDFRVVPFFFAGFYYESFWCFLCINGMGKGEERFNRVGAPKS
jgi:hypothetical protein